MRDVISHTKGVVTNVLMSYRFSDTGFLLASHGHRTVEILPFVLVRIEINMRGVIFGLIENPRSRQLEGKTQHAESAGELI